ncbi:MAG: pseudouridine-5'-phosphate glycosidase [Armatimonadota bacterium]
MKEPFEIAQNVKSALNRNAPVIALESTVIAHGLPGNAGVKAALSMVREADKEGCVAAVIGIVEGKVKIGLTEEEIVRFAHSGDALKVSTREIAPTIVSKCDGATTVAATAYIAANAGISVMATGGIGGVHRGASESWDISADLWELVKTPSIVVCSGPKAVLDLGLTLEWLETHQVPVYGYGTDELPAFYSPHSGLKVPKLDSPKEVLELYTARLGVGQKSGMVIAAPIPEKDAIDVQESIDQAIKSAKEEGIFGPALTPWLLKKIQESYGEKAVDANVALLINNARIAAKIAVELCSNRDKHIGFH